MPNTGPKSVSRQSPGASVEACRVAVAVLRRDRQVFVQRRPPGRPHGGLWEFPGGKVEAGESLSAALCRELEEELGIRHVVPGAVLIRVPWSYAGRRVVLEVFEIFRWSGEPCGAEGQEIAWVEPQQLDTLEWPAANWGIVRALQLPDRYLITEQPSAGSLESWLAKIERALAAGVRLVQLRRHDLDTDAFLAHGRALRTLCRRYAARLLVNRGDDLDVALQVGGDGLHLASRQLNTLRQRPAGVEWVAASCHDCQEITSAAALGVDFAVVSPVRWTPSHPDRQPLGWPLFAEQAAAAPFPLFALGGVGPADVDTARAHGGQGVAAVRGLLHGVDRP